MAKCHNAVGLIFVSCLLVPFLLLAAGCSGSSAVNPGSGLSSSPDTAAVVAPRPLAMPKLPAPASITRDASVIESSLVLNGASFRDDLTHQNVSIDNDSCIYDPSFLSGENPLYSEVALAIYSFDISSVEDSVLEACDLDVDGIPDLVIGTARVFAGLPSLSQDKWEWTELSKQPGSDAGGNQNWSFGEGSLTSLRERAPQGVLNVCIVVFGDTALDVSRVALSAPLVDGAQPVMQELFRVTGWNLKENKGARMGSVSLDCDDEDRLHATFFDSSNQQLYYFQADGRIVREMALDCDAPVGSSNSVCVTPDGSLLVAYSDDDRHQGVYRWMAPEAISNMDWSPRSTFASGDDGSGMLSRVGARCRCVEGYGGTMDVFYENLDNGRLMRSNFQLGALAVEDVITDLGDRASSPSPVHCPDGTCVAYLSRSPGSSVVRLMLATQDAVGAWSSHVLADDVHVPDGLDVDDDCDGFCDASIVPGTDEVVVAYSSPNGFSVVHFDLSSSSVLLRESPTRASTGGAFVRVHALHNGSVRVCHYDTAARTIYFENGDVPTGEDFVSQPARILDTTVGEVCDDMDFWLDPDSDGDGFHQAVLVSATSFTSPLGQSKHTKTGHVTLLK